MLPKFLLTAVGFLLLTSCAQDPPPTAPPTAQPVAALDDTRVALQLVADAGLNLDAAGLAAPVRVRFYQLKNAANFLRADYFALTERANPTLGADLLDQDEVWVRPGEQRQLSRELDIQTRHLGLVVGYRDIDRAQWRTVLTLAPHQTNKFLINLDAHGLRSDVALSPAQ
jgi:type VI secretion system protein VasD